MPNNNYSQAPVLLKKGEKNRPSQKYGKGKAIRSIELENIIFQNIGGKCGAQLKLMLFLTGNTDDGTFSVATKTVCDRCGMTEETYKKARSALVEKGWIIHEEGKIIVDYDAIYDSAKLTEESTYSVKAEDTEANRSKDIESTSSQDFQNTYNNIISDRIISVNKIKNITEPKVADVRPRYDSEFRF